MTKDHAPTVSDAAFLLAKIRAEADRVERIERAAIRYDGRTYSAPTMDHDEVARAMHLHGLCGVVLHNDALGFITNKGRFVPTILPKYES